MKKELAIRTLKRIKEINENRNKLKALGVDLIELVDGVNLLEGHVAAAFITNEDGFENALELVHWWLYDKVDKIITLANNSKLDVTTPEDFVDFLESHFFFK